MMVPNDHSKILGILFLIAGGLISLLGLVLAFVYGLMGLMFAANAKGDGAMVGGIFVILAIVVGLLFLLAGGVHLFSGWKLFKGNPNGKVLAIISSILILPIFIPFGAALGIYSLWFIFSDQGKAFFSGNGAVNPVPSPLQQQPPPPPHNWQS